MSDPLDDRLRDILYKFKAEEFPGWSGAQISEIKKAFAGKGYIQLPDDFMEVTADDVKRMTGPEFYLKFMDEVLHISDEDMDSRLALGRAYREAAKRAAGIADKPQGV